MAEWLAAQGVDSARVIVEDQLSACISVFVVFLHIIFFEKIEYILIGRVYFCTIYKYECREKTGKAVQDLTMEPGRRERSRTAADQAED